MVQNRKAQIIFRSIYLVIAFVGVLATFGTFEGKYNPNWYVYFTNISNYICFFTMIALLCYSARDYKKGEKEGVTDQAPLFRFCVCILISITFFAYNTMLSNPFSAEYWMNWQSLILHVICPIMFVVDYLLFSKHRSVNVWAPLFAGIMPAIYVLLILVRGEVVLGSGVLEYPYYFFDAHALGYGMVMIYVLVFMVLFTGLGYLIWAYDKLILSDDGKLKFDFSPLPKPEKLIKEDLSPEDATDGEQSDVADDGSKKTQDENDKAEELIPEKKDSTDARE